MISCPEGHSCCKSVFSIFFFYFLFRNGGKSDYLNVEQLVCFLNEVSFFLFLIIDKSCSFAPASWLPINHPLTQVLLYLLLFTFMRPASPSQLQTHFTLENRIVTWCLVWHFVAPCSFRLAMVSLQLAFACLLSPVLHWINRKTSESPWNVLRMSVQSHQIKKVTATKGCCFNFVCCHCQ